MSHILLAEPVVSHQVNEQVPPKEEHIAGSTRIEEKPSLFDWNEREGTTVDPLRRAVCIICLANPEQDTRHDKHQSCNNHRRDHNTTLISPCIILTEARQDQRHERGQIRFDHFIFKKPFRKSYICFNITHHIVAFTQI
jgi:hypothetical protein